MFMYEPGGEFHVAKAGGLQSAVIQAELAVRVTAIQYVTSLLK